MPGKRAMAYVSILFVAEASYGAMGMGWLAHHPHALDANAMQQAANSCIGEHDFRHFEQPCVNHIPHTGAGPFRFNQIVMVLISPSLVMPSYTIWLGT